ncbi:MAG TPA: VWA domain-containing protein, partial [Thermoguttaceae bacterium]|nr:VWA domain-containing protein [Thermoguttaceae bacterium]
MFEISLDQGYRVWTMLAVAGLAVVLVGVFYYRAFGTLEARQWRGLLALRVAAILLIVLLLFRPVLSYQKELKERPSLVFLLDTSSSMSISDDATGVTRFNQARSRIEQWWGQLEGDFDLYLIEFSEQAQPLSGLEQLAAAKPDGNATSLSGAMSLSRKLRDAENRPVEPEAVVMLSDGIHNSSRDPLEEAARMKTVVHTVGVGASLRNDLSYRDIQVAGIDCPDRLLLSNKARITASVEGVGLTGRVITVVLSEDEREIGQAELTLDQLEGSQEVEFEFRPETKGRHSYTVHVAAVAEEKIEENNQRSAMAMVVEPGIRVLYLEGTLRPEYGALVDRFLAKDPDLEFCSLVQTRPNKFLRRTNIPDLVLTAIPDDAETVNTFDVFIFGDLDASYIRPEQQELFVQRVRDGAGLVMLGGYHSLGPGGYDGTPLGEILPVELGGPDIGQIDEPFLPTLTPDGTHHPIFANIAGFFPTAQGEPKLAGLPLLSGCARVAGPRPGATVLATYEEEGARGEGRGAREEGTRGEGRGTSDGGEGSAPTTPSPLAPHPSPLVPNPSPLVPNPSPLAPDPSPL